MVWLIDEFACNHLTSIRHYVGLPLAFLFELHGWYVTATILFLGFPIAHSEDVWRKMTSLVDSVLTRIDEM